MAAEPRAVASAATDINHATDVCSRSLDVTVLKVKTGNREKFNAIFTLAKRDVRAIFVTDLFVA